MLCMPTRFSFVRPDERMPPNGAIIFGDLIGKPGALRSA
jgi:hypothetical protein